MNNLIHNKPLEFEAILFVIIGAVVGFYFVHAQNKPDQFANQATIYSQAAEPSKEEPLQTVPSVSPTAPMSQISSDGTKKVTVQIEENTDATRTFTISTDDKKAIFSEKLNVGESISLPFNSWSADNRFFFIKETTREGTSILVFKADGQPFADGEAYLDLTGTFRARVGDTFDVATGWAEDDLIVINTKLTDGTQGSSYWFAVPSKAIIPLAVQF